MVRLLEAADELCAGTPLSWRNHRRLAKKRALAIKYSRSQAQRLKLYRELIAVTRATLGHLQEAMARLATAPSVAGEIWQVQAQHYRPLIAQIIEQSERRVLRGEVVPAQEKLVSLFEAHADIIVKGSREPCYGHKLNLTSGRSGLILDVVIETGNPADSERFLPMLDRHIAFYGSPPRQTAADGGYATRDNLDQAKARGVADVAFHKKRGLSIEDMVRSRWVYRRLRSFRAGIEAGISCLKRAYGLARSSWRGLEHFKAYIWSSVVAYNLTLLARLKPA
jgi:IS5 family transposase